MSSEERIRELKAKADAAWEAYEDAYDDAFGPRRKAYREAVAPALEAWVEAHNELAIANGQARETKAEREFGANTARNQQGKLHGSNTPSEVGAEDDAPSGRRLGLERGGKGDGARIGAAIRRRTCPTCGERRAEPFDQPSPGDGATEPSGTESQASAQPTVHDELEAAGILPTMDAEKAFRIGFRAGRERTENRVAKNLARSIERHRRES